LLFKLKFINQIGSCPFSYLLSWGGRTCVACLLEKEVLQIYYGYCIISATFLYIYILRCLLFHPTFDIVLCLFVAWCVVFTVLGCVALCIYTSCVCDLNVAVFWCIMRWNMLCWLLLSLVCFCSSINLLSLLRIIKHWSSKNFNSHTGRSCFIFYNTVSVTDQDETN
jgi:hypothetical protein